MTTAKKTCSTTAVGLVLGVLAVSASANAEVIGRYRTNGESANLFYQQGCNYIFMSIGRNLNETGTSLTYAVGNQCGTGAWSEGLGRIPDEAFTGNATPGQGLRLDVSSLGLNPQVFFASGAPVTLAVTWTPNGRCRQRFSGTARYEHEAMDGTTFALQSVGQSSSFCSDAELSVTGPVTFSATATDAFVGEEKGVSHEFERRGGTTK
jgi:hypothetical protein